MQAIARLLNRSADFRVFSLGLIWSTLGSVAVRLTPLLTTVLIARWFGIEFVGKFAITYGTFVSAGMLASAGVSLMAVRNVAAYAKTDPALAGRLAGMALLLAAACGSLLGLVIFLFAGPLAESLLKQPQLAYYLTLIAPFIVLSAVNTVQQSILLGLQEYKVIARLNVILGVALIVAVPSGLYLYGLTGCFLAMGGAYLLACLITQPVVLARMRAAELKLSFRGAFSEWPMIVRYAIPALLASVLYEPVNWICTTIVVSQPGGLEQVGVYFIAMQLETLLLFVPQIVIQVIIPMLSTGFGERSRARVTNALRMGMGTNLLIAIGFLGVMLLFGDWFLAIFKLDPSLRWNVFLVVVLSSAMIAVALPLGQVPVSSGYMWTGLLITGGWAFTFVLFTFLLREHGAFGLVVARAIAWGAQSIVYVLFTRFAVGARCEAAPA